MPAFITITARLARDPELRETPNGTPICELTLPNDTGYGDHKLTTWWQCSVWGKRGETAAKHLKKGDWVAITGVPQLRKYEKRDGTQGSSLEVKVSDWGFCGPKQQASEPRQQHRSASYRRSDYNEGAPSADLPF